MAVKTKAQILTDVDLHIKPQVGSDKVTPQELKGILVDMLDSVAFAGGGGASGAAGGDLTGSYPNPTIGAATVNTVKLIDNAVSAAKIQPESVTKDKLSKNGAVAGDVFQYDGDSWELVQMVGGGASGAAGGDLAGSYPNPTIGTDKVTTAKIANDAVTTAKIADNAVSENKIVNGSITHNKIALDAVTNSRIADNNITTTKIADGNVTLPKLGQSGATTGQVPTWNGTAWVAATPSAGGGSPTGAAGGDLTGNYPNPTIGTDKVTTVKIADFNVTESKLADNSVTTPKILDNAVTTAKLPDNAVTTPKLANENVTTVKIANEAVTNAKLAANSVDASKIIDGNIVASKLDVNAVTETKIMDGAVTENKIASNAVTETKIAQNAVTTFKIQDLNVTEAKLANNSVSQAKLTANAVGSSNIDDNAVNSWKLANEAVTLPKIAKAGATTGQVVSFDGTNIVWATPASGGTPTGAAGGDLTGSYPNPTIGTDKVTTAKIANDAVTTAKIALEAVDVNKIAPDAVTTIKIANNSVTTAKIADNSVTTAKIPDSGITTAKLDNSAVTNGKIAAQTILFDRFNQNGAAIGQCPVFTATGWNVGTPTGDVAKETPTLSAAFAGGTAQRTILTATTVGGENVFLPSVTKADLNTRKVRVVFFGSTTLQDLYDRFATYTGSLFVEFMNRSIDGNFTNDTYGNGVITPRTNDMCERFFTDVAPLNPDIVIIGGWDFESIGYNTSGAAIADYIRASFLLGVRRLVNTIEKTGAKVLMIGAIPNSVTATAQMWSFAKGINEQLEAQYGLIFDLTGEDIADANGVMASAVRGAVAGNVLSAGNSGGAEYVRSMCSYHLLVNPTMLGRLRQRYTARKLTATQTTAYATVKAKSGSPYFFYPFAPKFNENNVAGYDNRPRSFTMGGWFGLDVANYPTTNGTKRDVFAIGAGSSSVVMRVVYNTTDVTNPHKVQLNINGAVTTVLQTSTTPTLDVTAWNHYAVRYNGVTDRVEFWFNFVKQSTSIAYSGGAMTALWDDVLVGASPYAGAIETGVKIADFAMWRKCLSVEQIKQWQFGKFSPTCLDILWQPCGASHGIVNEAPTMMSIESYPDAFDYAVG